MRETTFMHFLSVAILACLSAFYANAEDPYRYYTWEVTYGKAPSLGNQQVILINGQFPGPTVDCVTNDNIIINVINKLDEPFLLTWNGIKQRKTTWQDGVLGTNCPIPPNSNWTYKFQAKDQIGTYFYFPSTKMHRASGGFGGFNVAHRSVIPVPYPMPAEEYTLLIGDWYKAGHKALAQRLDSGYSLPPPDAILINGLPRDAVFTGERARPNPQGSFHYGTIPVARTIILANSNSKIGGKLRYAVNRVSYVDPSTPLKLADWYNIPGVFNLNTIKDTPSPGPAFLGVSVIGTALHDFIEIVFQNNELKFQSWHLDGNSFYVVAYGPGQWTPKMRRKYNNIDGVARHTVPVIK
ncbi:Copper-resistance protein [Trema orientale]|uniref:Copper-resistance protein n=1 Tax=Trema orientale TaxID=63057 RepID=A0A2P5FY65_TREOI|nr:Copper-resistance protein [Trema orientale]